MTIEPTPVYERTFTGPAAWRGDALQPDDLPLALPDDVINELDQALDIARCEAKTLDTVSGADFQRPALQDFAQSLRKELGNGTGLTLVRGFPIDRYTSEEAAMLYWGVGSALGPTLPQNAKGDRLYSVRNEGYSITRDYGAIGVRYSKTTESFHFHTDSAPNLSGPAPDLIGLFALRTAKSGGESLLVSAEAVHNILLDEYPATLQHLYHPVHHDRTAEWQPGEPRTLLAPIFRHEHSLQMRYMRFYIEHGHEKAGAPLTAEHRSVLDCLDEVMDRPGLHLRLALEPGDMLFLNNQRVLHSRTAFEDYSKPQHRRHYARIWMRTAL